MAKRKAPGKTSKIKVVEDPGAAAPADDLDQLPDDAVAAMVEAVEPATEPAPKRGRQPAGAKAKTAGMAEGPSMNGFEAVVVTANFVKQIGGVERAKEALKAFEKVKAAL